MFRLSEEYYARGYDDYGDYLNSYRNRNAENTDTYDYNCGGEALKTYSFYFPYYIDADEEDERIAEMIEDGMDAEEIKELLLTEYTEKMLEDFPDTLRILSKPTEVLPNERLIYFRVALEIFDDELPYSYTGIDTDFHFCYFEDGHWYEKRGGLAPHQNCDERVRSGVWQSGRGLCYDSRTVYLALKES